MLTPKGLKIRHTPKKDYTKELKVSNYHHMPYRGPSIQIMFTLGPKVCKYYLHWAIWIPRDGHIVKNRVSLL